MLELQNDNKVQENETVDSLEEKNRRNILRRSTKSRKNPVRYQDYVFLTYQEVITGVDRINWSKAIKEEKKSLEENET